jgi:hypothetical protein
MFSRRKPGSSDLRHITYLRHIPVGGAAIVRIQLTNKRGIPVEPFHLNRNTGRIILRNEGITVGAGKSILVRFL